MASLPTRVSAGALAVLAEGVQKRFGAATALADATLTVPAGAAYLLAGSNGAGKTTLLKVLMGLVRPDLGSVRVLGLENARDEVAIRICTGFCSDASELPARRLPLARFIAYHAAHYASWDTQYAARLVAALGVPLGRPCQALSTSEVRRCSLVMALAHRPSLLLLDEPLSGLDPVMRDEVLGIVSDHLAAVETTLVIAAQEASELALLMSHVGVLRAGRFILQAPLADVRALLQRYLVQIPTPWSPDPALTAAVLHRADGGREIEWTMWGEEPRLIAAFESCGAAVRNVTQVPLPDAIRVLLRPRAAVADA